MSRMIVLCLILPIAASGCAADSPDAASAEQSLTNLAWRTWDNDSVHFCGNRQHPYDYIPVCGMTRLALQTRSEGGQVYQSYYLRLYGEVNAHQGTIIGSTHRDGDATPRWRQIAQGEYELTTYFDQNGARLDDSFRIPAFGAAPIQPEGIIVLESAIGKQTGRLFKRLERVTAPDGSTHDEQVTIQDEPADLVFAYGFADGIINTYPGIYLYEVNQVYAPNFHINAQIYGTRIDAPILGSRSE